MVFLCSGFRSPLSSLLCFIAVFFIINVSLWYFTDEVENPCVDRIYICNREPHQDLRWGSVQVRFKPHPPSLAHPSKRTFWYVHSLIRVLETLHSWLFKMRSVKILIRLRECALWSESSLGVHVRRYVVSRFGLFSDLSFYLLNASRIFSIGT